MSVMPHSCKKYPGVLAAWARWVLKQRECFVNFLLQFLCILNTACQECWVVKYHAWVDFPSLCHCSCDMTKCTYFRTAEAGSGMGMGLCFLAIGGMGTGLCSCNAKGFSDALIFKTSG